MNERITLLSKGYSTGLAAKAPFDELRVVSKVEPQRTPSINKLEIRNSKSEIRNKWKAKFEA